jgi:hypothetical protein
MVGWMLRADDFVLVQGIRDTRGTLSRWSDAPGPIMRRWLLGAFAIAGALLLAVLVIALISTPDPTPVAFAGLTEPSSMEGVLVVMKRNALVLALHGFACVAGFIAGSSLPLEAARYKGVWRWIHDKAGPLAISFVTAATIFSLLTQSYVLGTATNTLAAQLDLPPGVLLMGLMPHAVPELIALFLPLAAWIIASRRGEWHQLLAATFVTVMLAVPVLIASAFVEVYGTPNLLRWLALG